MGFEELYQRAVKKRVAQRPDPDDQPQIVSGHQAEYNADHYYSYITEDAGILKRDFPPGCLFNDQSHAVIGRDPHFRHHVESHSKSGKKTADYQSRDPQGQAHMNFEYILHYPADEVRSISNADHVYDGSRSNAFPDSEEYHHKNPGVHDELPGAEAHAEISADSQIHTGESVYTEGAQPEAAYADTDKQDSSQHHDTSFYKKAL